MFTLRERLSIDLSGGLGKGQQSVWMRRWGIEGTGRDRNGGAGLRFVLRHIRDELRAWGVGAGCIDGGVKGRGEFEGWDDRLRFAMGFEGALGAEEGALMLGTITRKVGEGGVAQGEGLCGEPGEDGFWGGLVVWFLLEALALHFETEGGAFEFLAAVDEPDGVGHLGDEFEFVGVAGLEGFLELEFVLEEEFALFAGEQDEGLAAETALNRVFGAGGEAGSGFVALGQAHVLGVQVIVCVGIHLLVSPFETSLWLEDGTAGWREKLEVEGL